MSIFGITITYKLLADLCTKIDVPNSVTFLIKTPIFDWLCGLVWLQERMPKRCV